MYREINGPHEHGRQAGLDPMDIVDTVGAAKLTGMSESWLNKVRVYDPTQSPAYMKCGRRVFYRVKDLWDWQNARTRRADG